MSVGGKIREARLAKGWSQAELARRANTSQQVIQRYEDGRDPKASILASISKALDVTMAYLLELADDSNLISRVSFVPVSLYGSVAAGTPIEMIEAEDTKEAPAPYVDDDPNAYLVRVKGDSMNRIIHDGSFALISPKYTEPNEHDIFLVTVNGDDATIKRVHMLANGIELIPDSYDPTYRPMVYDFGKEDTPPIRILGKVVWWCKEF